MIKAFPKNCRRTRAKIQLVSRPSHLLEVGSRQKDKGVGVLAKVRFACLLSHQSFLQNKEVREPATLEGGLCEERLGF